MDRGPAPTVDARWQREGDGEHYAKCSLSFGLGESEPLFARLREHLPQDEPPPKQPRTE